MKFEKMEYKRVDYSAFQKEFDKLSVSFQNSRSAEKQLDILKTYFGLCDQYDTMYNLSMIRHTINTEDKFYSGENDYYDEYEPKFDELDKNFLKLLVASPFRKELEEKLGSLLFINAEISIRAFDNSIIEDRVEENKLVTRYDNLIASAQIDFDGKKQTLSSLAFYMNSKDRETRKKAYAARTGFFMEHAEELDEIYDELVKVRTKQAKKLGFQNYIELGYLRQGRNCYGEKDVKAFRELVVEYLVPLNRKLYEKQRRRLGVDTLMFYDEKTLFQDGNPLPVGTPEQIFENGKKMYHELSGETSEFIDFMLENDLFDVLSKKGKAQGGYCTFIAGYKSPFIFANFNGTHDDLGVLTHEAGHAFESYLCRDIYPPTYRTPTMETAEIHSMSMEFFTWPWMKLFFENADKYHFLHLSEAINFIPYGCAVDEFQHIVYENPDLSPAERKDAWKQLEHKYLPHLNFGDDSFFGRGGTWQRQIHIYEVPFYYIDYCLAQTCALQFWSLSLKDRKTAWDKYIELCKLGGTGTFTELLKKIKLPNPFERSCVETVVKAADEWLEKSIF